MSEPTKADLQESLDAAAEKILGLEERLFEAQVAARLAEAGQNALYRMLLELRAGAEAQANAEAGAGGE